MRRRTLVWTVAAACALGIGAYVLDVTHGYYPLFPGSQQLVRGVRPSHGMLTAQEAITVAKRYAGRQWNSHVPVATAFGILKASRLWGPVWLVTDPDALIPSTGPNPQPTRAKTAFLTRRSLTVVVNARTGKPVEAFAPAGVYHGDGP